MTVSKISGSQVSLGVSPLSWTNDVLAELGGDIPSEVCLKDAADNGYDGVELAWRDRCVRQVPAVRLPSGQGRDLFRNTFFCS